MMIFRKLILTVYFLIVFFIFVVLFFLNMLTLAKISSLRKLSFAVLGILSDICYLINRKDNYK